MPTEVMVALIGLLGSAAGTFTGIMVSAKLTAYRLSELEKKVEKHNTVIERTYKLEEAQAVMQEQIKVANHRIGDLEKRKRGMMTKSIDWTRKLTSRKFWAAVVGFVSPIMVAAGAGDNEITQVTAIIMGGATLIAYIIGEGLTDAAAAGKEPETEERVATK